MNLQAGQRMDPHLAYIIELKTRKLPKPNLTQIKDPALKKWLRHYDQYFLQDEILYRAPHHNSNSHPQHVLLIPSTLQDQVFVCFGRCSAATTVHSVTKIHANVCIM